ncbi:MAG: carboxypeptidase-like regulatory domain-containing protein [Bacteroidales bacterium]|nr:carboxypeptidase-like regulatory domain-containing protein [Bacteroidales bacterium]
MNLRTLLRSLVWAWGLCAGTLMAQTQNIEGRVLLSDSLHAASYASVYVPSTGQGTVCDKEGHFLLEGLGKMECPIEVSYMGYSTHKEVIRFDTASIVRLQVTMEEEPINLANVFITPNGEDAAVYLFNKVLQQSKANRKRLLHFEATVHTRFHIQDYDFWSYFPKFLTFMMKPVVVSAGAGALFSVMTQNPLVDLEISCLMDYAKNKLRYVKDEIVNSNIGLDAKMTKYFCKDNHIDPLKLYEKMSEYALKKATEQPGYFKMLGSVEEQGHEVNILQHIFYKGDTVLSSQTYYVMEDVWSLLRYEWKGRRGGEYRMEFRDIGEDIFLPVCRVDLPDTVETFLTKQLKSSKEWMEENNQEPSGPFKRWDELALSGREFNPYMSKNYSVQYKNVQCREE